MNNVVAILILIIGTLICTYLLPWYCIAMIGIILGYIWKIKGLNAFGIGLLIPALTWITIVLIKGANQDINVAEILSDLFGGMSTPIIYLITGLTIGLVSGMAMLCGNILFKIKAKSS